MWFSHFKIDTKYSEQVLTPNIVHLIGVHIYKHILGSITWTKFDEFSENFLMGGGVISDPKNYVALFR